MVFLSFKLNPSYFFLVKITIERCDDITDSSIKLFYGLSLGFFRCAERMTPPSGRIAIPLFTSPESCSSILLEVLAKGGLEVVHQQQQRWHSTEQLIPSYLSSPPLCWFYAATNGRNVKG